MDVETLDHELEAQVIAKELDIDTLETVARVSLGLNVNKMTSAEIKRDVRMYAKGNPKEFLIIINDPALRLQNLAHKLIDEKVLASRNNDKEVYYNLSTNKKRLITVPFGQKPAEALADFFKTDDGIEVMKMLQKRLNNL